MPKIKKRRVGFSLDMTPMVDVAFLLLTFFMLTTQFKPPEAVAVQLPSSTSNRRLPESDILTVSISKEGIAYIGVDSQPARERIFKSLFEPRLKEAGVAGIEDSLKKFRVTDGFAVDLKDLEGSITAARVANPKLRPVIKSDVDADFEVVEKVMDAFKKTGMPTFNLITSLEGGGSGFTPNAPAPPAH